MPTGNRAETARTGVDVPPIRAPDTRNRNCPDARWCRFAQEVSGAAALRIKPAMYQMRTGRLSSSIPPVLKRRSEAALTEAVSPRSAEPAGLLRRSLATCVLHGAHGRRNLLGRRLEKELPS
jgi:hypothetical protein